MKRRIFQALGALLAALVIIGSVAPFLNADRYRERIRASLSSALGRDVTVGEVRLNLFTGPGFLLSNVVIADDPSISREPFAYVAELRAIPRIWSLWTGKLEFSSLILDDAHLNVARSEHQGGVPRWNFEPLLRPGLLAVFPTIRLRDSRINFKFDDRKSAFYLLNADLEITPRSNDGSDWDLRFAGEPARTDRPAHGFGSLAARGRWHGVRKQAGNLELDVRMDRSEIGDVVALINGHDAGVHGLVTGRVHVAGPVSGLGVEGEIRFSELHGWDQGPPAGGVWPFRISGTLNTPAQHLELFAAPPGEPPQLAGHVVANGYLEQPDWSFDLRANNLPVSPLIGLLRNFGAVLPDRMAVSGALDGQLTYQREQGWRGNADVRDAELELRALPTIHFERAALAFADGTAQLGPAGIVSGTEPVGTVHADYKLADGSARVTLSSDGRPLLGLLSQFPMPAVPLLSELRAGNWDGELVYNQPAASDPAPSAPRWSGHGTLTDAEAALPELSGPVSIDSAYVRLNGAAVDLERLHLHAGALRIGGEYHYVPAAARPHQFRLELPGADVADLEALLLPLLRRQTSLIDLALTLGSTAAPPWLKQMHAEGTLQIEALLAGATELRKVRTHVQWDGTQMLLPDLQSRIAGASMTGKLAVSLRDPMPRYSLAGKLAGVQWQGGSMDTAVKVETTGTGLQTLANLKLDASFDGRDINIEPLGPVDRFTGSGEVRWGGAGPQFRVSELRLWSGGDIWTGSGSTQSDGDMLMQLTNNARQLNLAGSLTDSTRNWVERQ